MKPETERLKELMRLTGWNQAQTAQQLGLAQSNVSRLLNEKTAMHGSTKVLLEKLIKDAEQPLEPDQNRRRENSDINL